MFDCCRRRMAKISGSVKPRVWMHFFNECDQTWWHKQYKWVSIVTIWTRYLYQMHIWNDELRVIHMLIDVSFLKSTFTIVIPLHLHISGLSGDTSIILWWDLFDSTGRNESRCSNDFCILKLASSWPLCPSMFIIHQMAGQRLMESLAKSCRKHFSHSP